MCNTLAIQINPEQIMSVKSLSQNKDKWWNTKSTQSKIDKNTVNIAAV